MDPRQILGGVLLLVIFGAFQAGYLNVLGQHAWIVAAVIFIAISWLIAQSYQKAFAENKDIWNFVIAFIIIITLIASYLAPYMPGIVLPSGGPATVTPILLSFWLVLAGAGKLIAGWTSKLKLVSLTGIIWLITAVTWVVNSGPNAYLHFALVVGLPSLLIGLLSKD